MGHDGYTYQHDGMPRTAGSRNIMKIAGDPVAINTRGRQIVALGEKMSAAAATLGLFADGSVGAGESFKAVREQAGEVHSDLATASARYSPSGEALVDYSIALSMVQHETDTLVDKAAAAWETVNSTSRTLSSAEGDQQSFDHNANHEVEQTGSRPSISGEQSSFDGALEEFQGYWGQYDAPVETWEAAYEAAITKLEKTNADGISDGFWDNAMPFIEGLLKVLAVVAVLLVIAAFVLTGPLALIAAAIAVIAGVISLLGEVARLKTGRGSWQEVGLAAVGVFPFGKLAKLGKLSSFASTGARFPRLSGAIRLGGSEFIGARNGLRAMDEILASKLPSVFEVGGLNSRNLFRVLYAPSNIKSAFATTGSWGNGWRALAGFAPGTAPTTVTQAVLGITDGYVKGLGAILNVGNLAGAR